MKAKEIAKYIIENYKNIDSIKLQKLLFFSQSLSLYFYEEILFEDEIEAWEKGPVIREVYNLMKNNELKYIPNNITKDDVRVIVILDYVFKYFGDKSSDELVNMTRKDNTAWKKTVIENNIRDFKKEQYIIPLNFIKNEMLLYKHIIKDLTEEYKIDKNYVTEYLKHILKII